MKHILLTFLFLVVTLSCYGQTKAAVIYDNRNAQQSQNIVRPPTRNTPYGISTSSHEVRCSNTSSFVRGDSLIIAFNLTTRGAVIASGEALHIVPVYRSGRNELRFPEILINGKKRSNYYQREQALLSHADYWALRPFALLTTDKRQSQTIFYSFAKLLPANMREGGSLYIEQFIEDCCDWHFVTSQPISIETQHTISLQKKPSDSTQPPVELATTRPVYESSVTFIRPKKEIVKERNEYLTLRINYIVGRYDVLPQHGNNAYELQKADNILRPLSIQRETYQIKNASIKGYASPEAPYEYNMTLSQRRADGFKQYLISKYGLYNLDNFYATGLGEDWDGLRQAVEQSNMMYRREVLALIDGVSIFSGREKMLMDLAGGEPYRYMLHTLYPSLRRMEMEIAYTVRSFETVEAEELIDKRPQDLSQEEIYEVAQLRNKKRLAQIDTKDYGREYDVAARYFPNDATANINAASAALVRGDLDEAWRYLSNVQNIPEAYNNLGVYYWLRGDGLRAGQYFRRALNVKDDEEKARKNLLLLEEWQQEKTDRQSQNMNTSTRMQ